MTYYRLSTSDIPRRDFLIPSLSAGRPLQWLRQGWRDFAARPATGLTYGLLAAAVGLVLTLGLSVGGYFYLVPVFTAGFLLVAPLLAVGLYADAKRRERPSAAPAQRTGRVLARNLGSIGEMGIILTLVFMNWIMLSNLLFGGVFHELLPTWDSVRPLSTLWAESLPFFAVYFGIGVLLAALVFRMCATSIPMMIDQDIDVFNAIFASWKAVGENKAAMTVWAFVIVALCGIGFLTFFIGFILVIPVLGYGSWHAYRELLQAKPVAET